MWDFLTRLNWGNIAEDVFIMVLGTVFLTLIYRFRKAISARLKRFLNRFHHFVKLKQCLPNHSLDHARLLFQNRQLRRANRDLGIQIEDLNFHLMKERECLSEDEKKFISLFLSDETLATRKVSKTLQWEHQLTLLIVDELTARGLITEDAELREMGVSGVYRLSVRGRRALRDLGLLGHK